METADNITSKTSDKATSKTVSDVTNPSMSKPTSETLNEFSSVTLNVFTNESVDHEGGDTSTADNSFDDVSKQESAQFSQDDLDLWQFLQERQDLKRYV